MAEPWGEILYRAAVILAGLVALLAVLNFLYNFSEGEPIVPIAAVGLAATIWLTGLCCRYLIDAAEIDGYPDKHRNADIKDVVLTASR